MGETCVLQQMLVKWILQLKNNSLLYNRKGINKPVQQRSGQQMLTGPQNMSKEGLNEIHSSSEQLTTRKRHQMRPEHPLLKPYQVAALLGRLFQRQPMKHLQIWMCAILQGRVELFFFFFKIIGLNNLSNAPGNSGLGCRVSPAGPSGMAKNLT